MNGALAVLLGLGLGIAVLFIAAALTRRVDVKSTQREPNPEIEAHIAKAISLTRRAKEDARKYDRR